MKLYLFATVLCTLVAAIAAAPAGEDPAGDTAFAANGVSEGFSSLQFSESGGRNQTAITLYEDGKVEGTIVLNSEGLPVAAYDASGNAIDAALLDADDEEVGFQTMARPSLGDLKRIWDFIKKHGRRARRFLACVGTRIDKVCWVDIVFCLGIRDPFTCLGAIVCGGPKIAECARR